MYGQLERSGRLCSASLRYKYGISTAPLTPIVTNGAVEKADSRDFEGLRTRCMTSPCKQINDNDVLARRCHAIIDNTSNNDNNINYNIL